MSDEKSDFFERNEAAADKIITTVPTAAITDIERIGIAGLTGPLVIFYGPANIGKTVTLLRLCSYVSASHSIEVDRTFRSDPDYSAAVDAFERQIQEEILAPSATAAVNFLLVNLARRGRTYCQLLEAPGEHFFPTAVDPNFSHPRYLNSIFQAAYKKVFAVFFEPQLLADSPRYSAYVASILKTLKRHADPKKDRVIIIYNKCDEKPNFYRSGRPLEVEFRKSLLSTEPFKALAEYLHSNRFRRVHFVPFSSGQFGLDTNRKPTYAMSAEYYPQTLWNAIDDCVRGRWWPWW